MQHVTERRNSKRFFSKLYNNAREFSLDEILYSYRLININDPSPANVRDYNRWRSPVYIRERRGPTIILSRKSGERDRVLCAAYKEERRLISWSITGRRESHHNTMTNNGGRLRTTSPSLHPRASRNEFGRSFVGHYLLAGVIPANELRIDMN